MNLRWYCGNASGSGPIFKSFESKGSPPEVGSRVYILDAQDKRHVWRVELVERRITFGRVGLDAISDQLKSSNLDKCLSEAYEHAAKLYNGIPSLDVKEKIINVCMDQAEITLQPDPEFKDLHTNYGYPK